MPEYPKNESLRHRLKQEITAAELQHRINPDVMFLVEALAEIERLNEALGVCGQQVEGLFKFINEHRGEKIDIIRPLRADDTSPRSKHKPFSSASGS